MYGEKFINESSNKKYDPPLSAEEIKKLYGEEMYKNYIMIQFIDLEWKLV